MILANLIHSKSNRMASAIIFLESLVVLYFILLVNYVFVCAGLYTIPGEEELELSFGIIFYANVIIPIIETLLFFIFIPLVIYSFDIKVNLRIFISVVIFSLAHRPEDMVFFAFYAVSGYYYAYCSSFFMFERDSSEKAFIYTTVNHAIWNLGVTTFGLLYY